MKVKLLLPTLAICLSLAGGRADAQSLKDIVNAISDIAGGEKELNLEGTWVYSGAAVAFESDDLLKKAGGVVAASAAEKKLNEQFEKAGIRPGMSKYVFSADDTFIHTLNQKEMKGTYSYDQEEGYITLRYMRLLPMKARITGNSRKIEMLFDSNKLLSLISFVGGISGNSAIKGIASLAGSYDGMMTGFELQKE